MPIFYLTSASISYLTQFILSVAITATLARRSCLRKERKPRCLLLTGFFAFITLFIGLLFLESASLPTRRLVVVYLENTTLAIALVFLLQFAYRFPALLTRRKWESHLVLGLSLAYTAWEAGYAILRFILLRGGEVLFRTPGMDYALLALLLWVPLVFLRQYVLLAIGSRQNGRGWLAALLRPEVPEARAAGSFALIYLFVASLSLFNILRDLYLLPTFLASSVISLGILVALFAFWNTYLNFQKETFSFMAKLAGTTLTVMLAFLGIVGWVISPVQQENFSPVLRDLRTLRFTPNEQGGYDITEIPFVFEADLGIDLNLSDADQEGKHVTEHILNTCSPALDFEFSFYGHPYSQVYACNDGTLGVGQPAVYRNYQYRYGAGTPLIMALLTDLYPDIGPGNVFVLQEANRLVVTWHRLRGFYEQETELTFQLSLYPSGVFEISYNGLPPAGSALLDFQPNDEPMSHVWAIGAVPGGMAWDQAPQFVDLAQLPLSTGTSGAVQDYLLGFRQHLNELFTPLAWLILAASISVIAGVPLLLYFNLVKPLEALLAGVRHVDDGNLDVQVEVKFQDEIGSLAQSFNNMVVWLKSLVTNLEERVAARTAELTGANDKLQQKLEVIEALQEELREQAIRDPLTGLFNRRFLQEMLAREFAQADRRKWEIGLILMDIDHFKNVNDRHGHQMGDQVLQELGKLLNASVRKGDIACRFGGEEFLVIMPNSSLENTHQRADEIRAAFEGLASRLIQDSGTRVTLSAGVVIYPRHGIDYDTLLKNADVALYQAKHQGRNRAERYGEQE